LRYVALRTEVTGKAVGFESVLCEIGYAFLAGIAGAVYEDHHRATKRKFPRDYFACLPGTARSCEQNVATMKE
jgi:hypothetical protein